MTEPAVDTWTADGIAEARRYFSTSVHGPNPNAAHVSSRKSRGIEAFEITSGRMAGRLGFGVALDPLVVRTTMFVE